MDLERIRALVALAVDNPLSEEARTAAVKACQEIAKSGLLGERSTPVPRAPDFNAGRDEWMAWVTARNASTAAETAVHGPDVSRVHMFRRTFCFRCKAMIEEQEESIRHAVRTGKRYSEKSECVRCFDKIAPAGVL